MTDVRITAGKTAAVNTTLFWLPINENTPRGVKLQLINRASGVAQYGTYSPSDTFFTHWQALPRFDDR